MKSPVAELSLCNHHMGATLLADLADSLIVAPKLQYLNIDGNDATIDAYLVMFANKPMWDMSEGRRSCTSSYVVTRTSARSNSLTTTS